MNMLERNKYTAIRLANLIRGLANPEEMFNVPLEDAIKNATTVKEREQMMILLNRIFNLRDIWQ